MKESKFSQMVKYMEGIATIILSGIIILIVISLLYIFIIGIKQDNQPTQTLSIETNKDKPTKNIPIWSLGNIENIEGSSSVMVALQRKNNNSKGSFKRDDFYVPNNKYNYLFINTKDNSKEWLFKHNNYMINDKLLLSNPKQKNIELILYRVIKKDTNFNNKLDIKDNQSIALSKPNGKGYKEILEGIDKYIGQQLLDDNKLLLLYQKNTIGFSATIDIKTFSIIDESSIPKLVSQE